MPIKPKRKRWLAAFWGLCLLCLYGCDLPDLFSDPLPTTEDVFVCEASALQSLSGTDETETRGRIYVYVVGEVRHPGVYEIEPRERLEAAIRAAGGFTEAAEPASVNLARTVTDGEQIEVLSREAYASCQAVRNESETGLVNINTAEEKTLTELPGIGQVLAQAIIDHRNKHGPFEKIEDIMQVNGIKQALFERIRDRITTGR